MPGDRHRRVRLEARAARRRPSPRPPLARPRRAARSAPGRRRAAPPSPRSSTPRRRPAKYSDDPGPLGQPRRQQPARARLRGRRPSAPAEQLGHLVVDASSRRSEKSVRPWRSRDQRPSTASQARRGRLAARDHLHLGAPQAGRDLELVEAVEPLLGHPQRLRDLRLRDARTAAASRCSYSRAPARSPPGTPRVSTASATSPAARAAGPAAPRSSGVARRTTTPGAVPAGSITWAPSGTSACLRLAACTASKSRWRSAPSAAAGSPRSAPRARRRAPASAR